MRGWLPAFLLQEGLTSLALERYLLAKKPVKLLKPLHCGRSSQAALAGTNFWLG